MEVWLEMEQPLGWPGRGRGVAAGGALGVWGRPSVGLCRDALGPSGALAVGCGREAGSVGWFVALAVFEHYR